MKFAIGRNALLALCCLSLVKAGDDFYFWNYSHHPYQTYYLEDYCGSAENTLCTAEAHTIHLNATGRGSAAVIRGFRTSRPSIERGLKCCITVKTLHSNRLNVQLDDIYLKQKRRGGKCENFLRFHGFEKQFGPICSEVGTNSFKTPKNTLEIEYVLSSENAPDFQKIKVVVTSTTETNTARCSSDNEHWQCDDGSCIWEGFRCETYNNCADWSDELYCGFFSRNWSIFIGIAGGVFLVLFTWCVYRCCCHCCCSRFSYAKQSRTVVTIKPFQFVSSLAPDGRCQAQQNIYTSLDVPYQNSLRVPGAPINPRRGPPTYNENAFLNPEYKSTYGTAEKKA